MAAQAHRPAAAEANAPLPPQNLDAEEYVIGALMLEGCPVDAVFEALNPRDFYRASHATVYRAAQALHAAGEPIDPLTLVAQLEKQGDLDKVATHELDGRTRIYELAALVPAATNAPHHARLVAGAARDRDLIDIGERIAQLGRDRTGDTQARWADAATLYAQLGDTQAAGKLELETWHQFERKSFEPMQLLVNRLWPEAAFGFIAAPPKKGKTWIGLAMNLAIATGRPFLDFEVPRPRPVVYIALEGHRAAIRARIGCLARGLGINPDSDELHNLHILYKPRGINLADPAWAHEIQRAVARVDARLVTIDVLRAAARIKENEQSEFSALRANLQPLTDNGVAVAMLHHFTKLNDTTRERTPGERMSGSGAMFGALDVGIYITGTDDNARRLRLEFDTRDLASPHTINVELEGKGTGENDSFTYLDTVRWEIDTTAPGVNPDDLKAPAAEIAEWVAAQGGDVEAGDITAHFEISADTLTRRRARLAKLGVDYVAHVGKRSRYALRTTPEDQPEQLDLTAETDIPPISSDDPPTLRTPSANPDPPHAEGQPFAEPFPLNQAETDLPSASLRKPDVRKVKHADLQDKQVPQGSAPFGSAPAHAGAHTRASAPAREEAEQWLLANAFMLEPDQAINHIVTTWPLLPITDIKNLTALAAQLHADQTATSTADGDDA